jgi:hypothetical protein
MIFYEKQYIVQHLYEMHNFEIDISYFEEIEMQQQEQLQQKIYEQQQEQLMLQQQQQQQLQIDGQTQQVSMDEGQQQHLLQQQQQQQQPQTLIPVGNANITNSNITDETAAVMMMMMNGNGNDTLNANQVPNQMDLNQILAAGGQLLPAGAFTIDSSGNAIATGSNTPIPVATATAIPIGLLNSQQQQHGSISNKGNISDSIATVAANLQQQTQSIQQHQQQQHQQQHVHTKQQPAINYSCTYCTFGADKLKKMSDHLKLQHTMREKNLHGQCETTTNSLAKRRFAIL